MGSQKGIIKTVGALTFIAAGAYGITWLMKQSQLANDTDISITGFALKGISDTQHADISLNIGILNKSGLKINLTGYDLNFYINNSYLGFSKSKLKEQYLIGPGQKTTIPVNVQFSPLEIAKHFEGIQNNKIQIRGKANVKTGILFLSIPVDYESPSIGIIASSFLQSLIQKIT